MSHSARIERVRRAIEEVRAGRMVILVDDEDRENEGDLCMAAERVTPEHINFMSRYGRGLICLTLTEDRVRQLGLSAQVGPGTTRFSTAFHVNIDARHGISTGISAADRARSIQIAVAPDAKPDDLVVPGHIMTIRARPGGVLVRSGHTEASSDLARLAGYAPAGAICEVIKDDGTMARLPDLEPFAKEHGLHIAFIADLIEYRLQYERLVRRTIEGTVVPAGIGVAAPFRAIHYTSDVANTDYVALVMGEPAPDRPILVRVQSACGPGDVFGSSACDCAAQMRQALRLISEQGEGVFVHVIPRESRFAHDLREHVLHESAGDAPFKLREYGMGAQVLQDLAVRRIRLMTNNPRKIVGLEGFALDLVERVPLRVGQTRDNLVLMRKKRERGELVDSDSPLVDKAEN